MNTRMKLQSSRALKRYLNDENLTQDRKQQQFANLPNRIKNRAMIFCGIDAITVLSYK